jgi:hypothetical protein
LKRLRIELADDFFSLFAIGELHEGESTWTASLAIDGHGDVGGLSDGREVGAEIRLARAVGEVPDEQTDCQGLLVKSPLSRRVSILSQRHTIKVKGHGQSHRNKETTSEADMGRGD